MGLDLGCGRHGVRTPTDLDYADFPSQAAAQEELNRTPGDPHGLDPDADGIACEVAAPLPSGSQLGAYVVVGVVLVAGVSSALFLLQRRRALLEGGRGDLEQRIVALGSDLREVAQVVGEIERDIQERQDLVDRLKKDAERAETLSQLSAKEVESVAQALRTQISTEERISFKKNIILTAITSVLTTIAAVIIDMYVT